MENLESVRIPDYVFGVGKLHTIGKISFRVYANDHLPPHFHVVHPQFHALVVIETLAIYAGSIPAQFERHVTAWATPNRPALIAEWNRVNPRFPVRG
jgi:hypothetical protein